MRYELLFAAVLAQGLPTHRETIEVRTVVVDVIVTDREGSFVHGLTESDFRVFEDDDERPIESVREIRHVGVDAGEAAVAGAAGLLSEEKAPPRSVILFFDFSYISTRSRHGLRRAGEAALTWARDQLLGDDRISVFLYDGELRMLVEDRTFTGEIADVVAAVTFNETSPWFDEKRAEGLQPLLIREREIKRRTLMEERRLFDGLIDSLEWVAARLEGRPGRKAVLLLSERQVLTKRAREALRDQVFARMQEADAAFYYLHTPGLEPQGKSASEGPALRGDIPAGTVDASLDLMTFVAEQTGGRVTRNTNEFRAELEAVTSDLGSYYQLSYTPGELKRGSTTSIRIEVDREGATLNHRRGYRAPADEADRSDADRALAVASMLGSRVSASPFLGDVRLVPFPRDDGALLGLLVRFPAEVFRERTGETATIAFHAEVRDHLGVPVAGLADELTLELTGSMRDAVYERGLEYLGQIEVPAMAGELRFVIRDGEDQTLALHTLPFDVTGRVVTMFVVDTEARPIHVLGDGGSAGPKDRLRLDEHRLHPRADGRVAPGEAILVMLELGAGALAEGDAIEFALLEGDAGRHPAKSTRWSLRGAGERGVVLAEVVLPTTGPGDYRLHAHGQLMGEPLAAETTVRVE